MKYTGTVSINETSTADVTLKAATVAVSSAIKSFFLDGTNLTKDATVKVFVNLGSAGATARQIRTYDSVIKAGQSIQLFPFGPMQADTDVTIKLASDGGGAGSVDVYYRMEVVADFEAPLFASTINVADSMDGYIRLTGSNRPPQALMDMWNGVRLRIVAGTGKGQETLITDYNYDAGDGTALISYLYRDGTPFTHDTDSEFEILPWRATEWSVSNSRSIATNASDAASRSNTALSRLGSITGSGNNTVLGFFKALLSKAAPTPSDVGGTFSAATDSTEALRDTLATAASLVTTDGKIDEIRAQTEKLEFTSGDVFTPTTQIPYITADGNPQDTLVIPVSDYTGKGVGQFTLNWRQYNDSAVIQAEVDNVYQINADGTIELLSSTVVSGSPSGTPVFTPGVTGIRYSWQKTAGWTTYFDVTDSTLAHNYLDSQVKAMDADSLSDDALSDAAVDKISLDTLAIVEAAEAAIIAAPVVIGSVGETPTKLLSDLKEIMDGIDDLLTGNIQ